SGPQTGAPPGSRAETPPPDQFSWSTMTSRVHSGGPVVDPVAPSAPAAHDQPNDGATPGAGRAASRQSHSGGTIASHRREYGIADPAEPGPPAAGRAAGAAVVPPAALDRRTGRRGPGPGGRGHLGRPERFRLARQGRDEDVADAEAQADA